MFQCTVIATIALYKPAPAEMQWEGSITGKICKIATDPSQVKMMKMALKRHPDHMSYLNGHPIEPLTGIGRHPFAAVGCGHSYGHNIDIFDISYIVLYNNCGRDSSAKAYLYDMGCSVYKHNTIQASAGGSSIPVFMNRYKSMCISFTKIFGWEPKNYSNWWADVPRDVAPLIEFHNERVTAEKFKSRLLERSTEDFVVVKLDIDNLINEMSIIKVIEHHSHLIDEFFFEYHYFFDGMDFGWGKSSKFKHVHNVTSAFTLMQKLRKKGIRAHFWV